ncbi:MAG: sigma-70 family RNA polymerase sigma factor [Candidatus Latescibacterota bacterium]|nr:MAG: sigma-70 family RNA polymerase sigma factor [Candidatus Latescibacterota bacterium]
MDEMEAQPVIESSDRDLAEAVLQYGDETAFRELYRRHTPRLLGFVSRLLGRTEAEAEDVVQDTWIRVCQALDRFRWESVFSTWLLGIGLNVVRDHIRRDARTNFLDIEEVPEPPGPMQLPEDRIDLDRSIGLLPDGYRVVLVLHDVEGMKHSEIAEKLGVSTGTTKSQLFKARNMLRALLSHSK